MIINVSESADFSIHNLPFGIFSTNELTPRAGIAIGDYIIDLYALAKLGLFPDIDEKIFLRDSLNSFISLGKKRTSKLRLDIQKWLISNDSPLKDKPEVFIEQHNAQMHLPVKIGDYTDFYSSIEHATNVGKMFRDPENALLPNWKHMPVAYHGRSSSIIVSGTDIHRPKGQILPKGETTPVFSASKLLDFELETAFIIGKDSELGASITSAEAEEYIFGMILFNDWSARDIQKWEYVPLGPFLGKNFASSISPWVVTMEALEPFRVKGPKQESVLSYLEFDGNKSFDIQLQVAIQPKGGVEEVVCNSNFKYMYWNMSQQLAHHTVNGCNVRVGDMLGSGTLSGPDESSLGSMLEISWAGSRSIEMKDGSSRKFIQDGDSVILRGYAESEGKRVGFGKLKTKVLPAK